jgi:UDP-N-acetyl-D-mannosaminuronate dehydrogenase
MVGMGYVGVTLATALATAGLNVVGVDRRPEVSEAINLGESLFHEFGLNEALATVVARGSLHSQRTDQPYPLTLDRWYEVRPPEVPYPALSTHQGRLDLLPLL